MASTFLRRLLDRRGPPIAIVVTSNTLPSDLGRGRFAAEAFQREIGEIAARFEVVSIDGEDYRHRRWDELALATADLEPVASLRAACDSDPAPADARVLLRLGELSQELEQVHPVHYAQIARQLEAVCIEDLRTIEQQAVALRLVHFVDKLYDQEVRLHVATQHLTALADVFSPTYRNGGYEKKYRRCLSRMHELVRETRAAPAVARLLVEPRYSVAELKRVFARLRRGKGQRQQSRSAGAGHWTTVLEEGVQVVGEGADDVVGAGEGQVGGVGGADAEDGHARGAGGFDSVGRVFDRQAAVGGNGQAFGGQQVDLRVGLAMGDVVA
jgi:hypothetical protein